MNNTIKTYLLNAFSLQMLEDFPASVLIEEVDREELGDLSKYKSCIGHKDTAAVLGVEFNRVNVSLKEGDSFIVAQLQGGRLPEGSTTLPEGFSFKFYVVKLGLVTDTLRLKNSMFYKGDEDDGFVEKGCINCGTAYYRPSDEDDPFCPDCHESEMGVEWWRAKYKEEQST